MEETNLWKITSKIFSALHCTTHVDHGLVGFKYIETGSYKDILPYVDKSFDLQVYQVVFS